MLAQHRAFLAMIRFSEGTEPNPWGENPYAVCFKHAMTITDFSNHPACLGWQGVPLEPLYGPKYRGLVSTAAGAYQITKATFLELAAALGTHDIFPFTQDAMALELVKRSRALPYVTAGDLATAIKLCAPTWASLPGSTAGQHTQSLGVLTARYTAALVTNATAAA